MHRHLKKKEKKKEPSETQSTGRIEVFHGLESNRLFTDIYSKLEKL